MSELPKDKTSRKLANFLEKYCFEYQATIYLPNEDGYSFIEKIETAKRLIKKDNPDQFILSFVSRFRKNGEKLHIAFYSWSPLVGVSVRERQEQYGFAVLGERSDHPRRRLISRHLRFDQIEGLIRKLREEKIYDLTLYFGKQKFRRYSFLNIKNEPSSLELGAIQQRYRSKRDERTEK